MTFCFFRPQGFYLAWEAEVCRLFPVLEEKMGDRLSFKVSTSALEPNGVWEYACTGIHQKDCNKETIKAAK